MFRTCLILSLSMAALLAAPVAAQSLPDECRRMAERAAQETPKPGTRLRISGSVAFGLSYRTEPRRGGVTFGAEREIVRLVPSDPRYRAALRACLRSRGVRSRP